jgi:hypothetical protein
LAFDKDKLKMDEPMTSIQMSTGIPEDRHLRLDLILPEGFPVGHSMVLAFISPYVETEPSVPVGTSR